MESFMKFIPAASDESVNNFASYFIDVNDKLLAIDPNLCYQWVTHEESSNVDPAEHIDEQTQEGALNLIAEVIRTSAEDPQPPPDKERAEMLLQEIGEVLSQKYGQDLMMFNNPILAKGNKKKFCKIASDMYRQVLRKSEKDSSRILRYLLTQG